MTEIENFIIIEILFLNIKITYKKRNAKINKKLALSPVNITEKKRVNVNPKIKNLFKNLKLKK